MSLLKSVISIFWTSNKSSVDIYNKSFRKKKTVRHLSTMLVQGNVNNMQVLKVVHRFEKRERIAHLIA
jgi:hypothetical protein